MFLSGGLVHTDMIGAELLLHISTTTGIQLANENAPIYCFEEYKQKRKAKEAVGKTTCGELQQHLCKQ